MLFFAAAKHCGITLDAVLTLDDLLKSKGDHRLETVDYDRTYLRKIFKNTAREDFREEAKTKSQTRLKKAYLFFIEKITIDYKNDSKEVTKMINKLLEAEISHASIEKEERAMLIFTFQNTRGASLTALEKLKAFIAHQYYCLTASTAQHKDFADKFTEIYQSIEETSQSEDTVLDYITKAHYSSYVNGVNIEMAYSRYTEKVRDKDKQLVWLEKVLENLARGYEAMAKLSKWFKKESTKENYIDYLGISLYSEKEMFYTAFIKYDSTERFSADNVSDDYNELFRLFEQLLFRATFTSEKGKKFLGTAGSRERFDEKLQTNTIKGWQDYINVKLNKKSSGRGTGRDDVRAIIGGAIYGAHSSAQICYVLWLYELDQSDKSDKKGVINKLLWSQIKTLDRGGEKTSVEHIAPQSIWRTDEYDHGEKSKAKGYDLIPKDLPWDNTDSKWSGTKKRYDARLHGWGNLLPITPALNSSLSDDPFREKIDVYKLAQVTIFNEVVETYAVDGDGSWTGEVIDKRQKDIVGFITKTWLS